MFTADGHQIRVTIDRLLTEMSRLWDEQAKALKRASLDGMSSVEIESYCHRQRQLRKLADELALWKQQEGGVMTGRKKKKRLHGTVEKIIKSPFPDTADKAHIDIEEAEELYREVRVENVVTDEQGDTAALKEGAQVDVVVEADSDATIKVPKT